MRRKMKDQAGAQSKLIRLFRSLLSSSSFGFPIRDSPQRILHTLPSNTSSSLAPTSYMSSSTSSLVFSLFLSLAAPSPSLWLNLILICLYLPCNFPPSTVDGNVSSGYGSLPVFVLCNLGCVARQVHSAGIGPSFS